ncbi:MAG: MBOAT family protein, partial [Oscillospiraceae bacterium]|nr:MBOAT family protein [Oscillospiraceae bacterium]
NGFFSYFEEISLKNNIWLILAAILCTFPLLQIPRRIREKYPNSNQLISVAGTAVCMILLVLSSILLVDSTTKAFLYYRF